MNGYNFTERMRKILARARTHAVLGGHSEVSPVHLALGLVDEGQGVAGAVLGTHRVNVADLRSELESRLPPHATRDEGEPEIPFTAAAKRVLERAMTEARELRHSYVGTEHLLLALFDPVAGDVGAVLGRHGLVREKTLAETLRLLGQDHA
jgi:ATP-dependent Clp protease ATP-binding subunit ClpC